MPRVRLPRRLSTQITVLVLGLILMTVGIGALVSFFQARSELDEHAGERALAVARVVATDADVVEAFSTPEPPAIIDPIAEHFREAAGAAFIVVADDRGIRYSHPNPQMIGTSLLDDPGENPEAVLSGKTFVGIQNGSLGPSMRAKTFRCPPPSTTATFMGTPISRAFSVAPLTIVAADFVERLIGSHPSRDPADLDPRQSVRCMKVNAPRTQDRQAPFARRP